MFANRFTAFLDASALVSSMKRDLLLSLAAAEFFRVRWSAEVLDEVERAVVRIVGHQHPDAPAEAARRVRNAIERAFEDALVVGYQPLVESCVGLPDPGDRHVLAAAIKTRASVIVTENSRHFPAALLHPLDIEPKTTDAFVADTIDLDQGRAVAAIRRMRERRRRPEQSAEQLLLRMEAIGLTQTVDALRMHRESL